MCHILVRHVRQCNVAACAIQSQAPDNNYRTPYRSDIRNKSTDRRTQRRTVNHNYRLSNTTTHRRTKTPGVENKNRSPKHKTEQNHRQLKATIDCRKKTTDRQTKKSHRSPEKLSTVQQNYRPLDSATYRRTQPLMTNYSIGHTKQPGASGVMYAMCPDSTAVRRYAIRAYSMVLLVLPRHVHLYHGHTRNAARSSYYGNGSSIAPL